MATQLTLNDGSLNSAGALKIKTNGTTEAVDISTGQVVTLAKDAVVNGLTVGRGAGAVSTNTAVGASALAANTTGFRNTAIGSNALAAETTGNSNTAVGRNALLVANGTVQSVAFGESTLTANTTGGYNTALGQAAMLSNTTGSNNTAVGQQALQANTTASNNTAVGYQAGYTNTVGASNVFVGQVAGKLTTGSYNTFVGDTSGYNASSGTFNAFFGQGSGYLVTTGAKNTIIGSYSGNQGGLDIRTASNYVVLSDGDGNPRMFFTGDGSFNVATAYSATTASAANLNIGSDGYFRRSTSALKYKQDVRDLESMDISGLRPVRYKSKCEGDDQTKDHLGLIADEAAEAGFEELVTRGADGEIEGFQYERLTVVLLKKLQVLEAEVKALKGQT